MWLTFDILLVIYSTMQPNCSNIQLENFKNLKYAELNIYKSVKK
ncbi:hypothetical protein AC229_0383 [Oenococcus oeni]|nr:hypothetical protein AC229_0383 [Oenococcus oeni]